MNTQSKLLIIAAAMLSLIPQMGLATGNAVNAACSGKFDNCKIGNQGAQGGATSVGIGLNAVGDKVTYAIGSFKANDSFGKLNDAATKTLALPSASANLLQSIRLYTFTPTMGTRLIKNQEQQLLFVAFDLTKALPVWTPSIVRDELDQVKNTSPSAKSAVYVYQHIKGEPVTQWTELGKAVTDATDLANEDGLKTTINPNARISIQLNPIRDENGVMSTPEPITGDLGTMK